MFEKIRKEPILQIILAALALIIVIAIFVPKSGNHSLNAGLNVNARLGNLKGGFNFETYANNEPTLVMFYAPWCGHCKRFKPEFDRLKSSYSGPGSIMDINCDEQKEMAKKHGVQSFPTIRLYKNGLEDTSNFSEYNGPRSASALEQYMSQNAGSSAPSGVVNEMPDQASPMTQMI